MCPTLFPREERRRSPFSQEGRASGEEDPDMGGEKRLCGNADRGAATAADSVQVFRAGLWSVQSAAGEFCVSDRSGTGGSVFRDRLFGHAVWVAGAAFSWTAQVGSGGGRDCARG